MSRTYKHYPVHSCFRTPSGNRQARVAGLRRSKTPPSTWDDLHFDKQCWLPYKVASGLAKKGVSYWDIVHHVQKKFKLLLDDAMWMAETAGWSKPKTPEGCLRVYDEVDEMGLKKARKIVVGEDTYRWKVSNRGGLHISVEKDGEKRREVFWLGDPSIVVTPGVVRRKIEERWGDV